MLLLIVLAGSSFGSYIYFQTEEWNNKIYTGISVMDVDLSGLTTDEARNKVHLQKIIRKK